MDALIEAGAHAASSPADVAAHSSIVITCVSDTQDVDEVILRENGAIYGLNEGDLVIDMSTISPEKTRYIAGCLDQKGVYMLDAPISGGSEGAARGTLSIMVGGDEAQVERAMPAFQAMGSKITHVGAIGRGPDGEAGESDSGCGNDAGVSEALLFAEAGGLDLNKTLEAVTAGAAGSWMLSNRGPQVVSTVIGDPASRLICSKRICGWCWKRRTRWVCRCWAQAPSLICTARCKSKVLARKGIMRW